MGERQRHGFGFERDVIEFHGFTPTENYTDKWDAYYGDTPVSIKVEQYGSDIEMADYFRNANNTEDFILIVGFWQGRKDNIVSIETLKINGQEWHELFPSKFSNLFRYVLNSVTNDYSDDAKWKNLCGFAKRKWQEETDNLIRPRFKRDHKSQKRIQCAINNKDFYSYFVNKYRCEI